MKDEKKTSQHDAAKLWAMLNGRGFVPASQIDMSAAKIRALCQDWPEHFISGREGYKIAAQATDAEIEYSIHDLRSRCRAMLKRSRTLQKLLVKRHHDHPDLAGN